MIASLSERTEVKPLGGEREMIEAFLDHHRDTLEWKCSGLTEEQLKRRACEPSNLTLLGILRHMAEVEYYWCEHILLGNDDNLDFFCSAEDPDGDFNDLNSHPAELVLRRWQDACETSRAHVQTIDNLNLVAVKAPTWDPNPVSLRYILIHLIEEYARHNGHADLLRERIDGETGV